MTNKAIIRPHRHKDSQKNIRKFRKLLQKQKVVFTETENEDGSTTFIY